MASFAFLGSFSAHGADGVVLSPSVRQQMDSGPAGRVPAGAEALLGKEIPKISDKHRVAASGDPQDYYSIGIYWWPNPVTGGLPYLCWDGEYNPESERYNRPKLEALGQDTLALARAFAETRDGRYAEKAREYFRIWYLDPETRMHPNLEYAQAWPGWTDGSPTGILEGVAFASKGPDAVALLYLSGGLPESEYQGIRRWFAALAQWLEESAPGKKVAKAENNHGPWYDMQLVSYFLFLGETAKARAVLSEVGPRRIAKLIRPDGRQPSELERTKAFDYSCHNLDALITLCEYGELVGLDLWSYTGPRGESVRKALDFLIPYAKESKPWPYQQLKGVRGVRLASLLNRAAPRYPGSGYEKTADELEALENAQKK